MTRRPLRHHPAELPHIFHWHACAPQSNNQLNNPHARLIIGPSTITLARHGRDHPLTFIPAQSVLRQSRLLSDVRNPKVVCKVHVPDTRRWSALQRKG